MEIGWTYSDLDEINDQGELIARGVIVRTGAEHPKRDLASCLRQDMFVLPSASLISRRAFRQVGGFDERLSGYEDDDLFLRLFQAGFHNVFLAELRRSVAHARDQQFLFSTDGDQPDDLCSQADTAVSRRP